MALRRLLFWLALAAVTGTAASQQVHTYTDRDAGPTRLALGYPVPMPVDSLTPVDGFRSYDSLHARHQALALEHDWISGHRVAGTIKGRDIFAYVLSDPDDVTASGLPESAFLVNGGIHAREWQSPEAVTGIMERFAERRGDGGLYDYLVENTRIVAIPVHNVDGFLQTQRYPERVIVGRDPTDADWPRDGRMRRKNMRGADEDLDTFADHLAGVDLNRNNPPYAPSPAASNDPDNLVFHGNGSFTEPEASALNGALALAGQDRLRLFTDFHSFGAIFFDFLTDNARRNQIQSRLISKGVRALIDLGTPHGRMSTGSIGSTDEYFAEFIQVPAWTHEIEPDGARAGRAYGGLGVTHDGFVLPDREIARVREEIADTYAMLFYAQAGPPAVQRVTIRDAAGATVYDALWQADGARARTLSVATNRRLLAGAEYTLTVTFDKPMRVRDASGAVAAYPGMNAPLAPEITLVGNGFEIELPTNAGGWLNTPATGSEPGYARYADDTFEVTFALPADAGDPGVNAVDLRIGAEDLAENALDADPSTVADWDGGHWVGYESADGTPGDLGGADSSIRLRIRQKQPDRLRFENERYEGREGALVPVTVIRDGDGEGAVQAHVVVDLLQIDVSFDRWELVPVQWADGETGARTVAVPTADDFEIDEVPHYNNQHDLSLEVTSGAAVVEDQDVELEVVQDNDDADLRVWNVLSPNIRRFAPYVDENEEIIPLSNDAAFGFALCHVISRVSRVDEAASLAVNLRDEQTYLLDPLNCNGDADNALDPVDRHVTVAGRHTVIRYPEEADAGRRLIRVTGDGRLSLRGVRLEGGRPEPPATGGAIRNEGELVAGDVVMLGNRANRGGALSNTGTATLTNVRLVANHSEQGGGAIHNGGSLSLAGATLSDNETPGRGGGILNQGPLTVADSTFLDNSGAPGDDLVSSSVVTLGNSVLGDLDGCVLEAGGSIDSAGFNLDAGGACGLAAEGDLTGTAPELLPLDDNWLHQAADGSPVLNAGPAEGCGPVDAAGTTRPFQFGAVFKSSHVRCDIGAAEKGIAVERGMWWNPDRSGHGIDLQRAGDQLILTWFTYEPDGSPVWYQAFAPFRTQAWEAELFRYQYDFETMSAEPELIGTVSLDFEDGDTAVFGWNLVPIGQGVGSEPFQPLVVDEGDAPIDLTGHWAAADLTDWGLTLDTQGATTIATIYYYDAGGNPRWAQGVGGGSMQADVALDSFTGFCPGCDMMARPISLKPAGEASVEFLTRRRGRISTNIVYPGDEGGEWQRTDTGIGTLSDPP